MIGFNERMTVRFEETANVSTKSFLDRISEGKEKQSWTNFLVTDSIDFKAINVNNGNLEIVRQPTFFNPFKANGRITIYIKELSDDVIKLKCEILPFDGIFPVIVGLLVAFIIFCLFVAFLFSSQLQTFAMIFVVGIIFGFIVYAQYLLNKHGLIDYSRRVVTELTREVKPATKKKK